MSFSVSEIRKLILNDSNRKDVVARYPFRITQHIACLIEYEGDPLWRQFVPDPRELVDTNGSLDPLGEENLSPLSGLVHRYPDRVLWLTTNQCAANCRFCTRKRLWTKENTITISESAINDVTNYIRRDKNIKDVILSGGDPLTLPYPLIERILKMLRSISHIDIIRIHTRLPIVSPKIIHNDLVDTLRKAQPLYVNIHVNHPNEISDDVAAVLTKMADAGIPLGSQTVLLKNVNDSSDILECLFRTLLKFRVKPYYLFQADLMQGTAHFRTPLTHGIKIMKHLRHKLSGIGMPHFMVDLLGGGGKIEIVPSFIDRIDSDRVFFFSRTCESLWYPLEPWEADELKSILGLKNISQRKHLHAVG